MAGFIFYQGPSVLDGQPIVGILTVNSTNRKTGNLAQTWIMRSDISPIDASKNNLDSSICGGCPHKHSVGGACYVNLGHGPNTIFKAFKNGRYDSLSAKDAALYMKKSGLGLRIGSYGDGAAIPFEVWESLVNNSSFSLGYTHQNSHKNFDKRMLNICMVSAETPRQATRYHNEGLRTFRVVSDYSELLPNEIVCPSENGITCVECKRCDGATQKGQSVAIQVHGVRKKRFITNHSKASDDIIIKV